MKKALILVVVVLALLWAPVAMAEMYVGAYGGAAIVPDSDLKGTDASIGAEFKDVQFDTGGTFGVKIGGRAPGDFRYLVAEGNIWRTSTGISHSADLIVSGVNYGAVDLDADVSLLNFSFSLLAQYPTGTFRPYGGIGFLVSYADVGDVTESVGGITVTVPGDDTTSFGFMGQAGLEYKVTDLLGLFGEYRYTWANYEFEFEEMDASTHNFLAGAALHF